METLATHRATTRTKEQFIYFHPIFTTITFAFTQPYYFGLAYLSYHSLANNKIGLFVLYIAIFTLLTAHWLMILKAFVRLVLNKPAIRLTQFRLYDHLNNTKFRWAEIKQPASFEHREWRYLPVAHSSEPILFKKIKNPFKYLLLVIARFIKRRKIFKINYFLLKGKNADILSTIKLYCHTK